MKLNLKKVHWLFIIGALVCILLTVVAVGVIKANSGKKEQASKEEIMDKAEEEKEQTESETLSEEEEQEIEPGDREVTEVEVESEELSKEEIAQMEEVLETQKGENGSGTAISKSKPGIPYYIKVNRLANCVTIYGKDANGAYTVPVKAMICSVGKDINDTPTGIFGTYAKYTWRYLFGEQYGQYTTRIVGHILFHSVPYLEPKKDKLKVDYYNNLGVGDSMGCIRLTVADAKWIYDNCPLGTTVEIYDDVNPGPLGKPSAMKIDPTSPYAGWDPTDPDPANPWHVTDKSPVFSGVKNITVERGNTASLVAHVVVKDFCGNIINASVTGNVDTNTCGHYPITYTATDALGNTATATAVVIVVDTTAPTIRQIESVVVNDSATDIRSLFMNAILATDGGVPLTAQFVTVDMSPLETAMANKAYGIVYCNAYAVDVSGNKSSVIKMKVSYESSDKQAPVITVVSSPEIIVNLTGAADDDAKKNLILDAAIAKVQEGACFVATDDVTATDKLVCSFASDSEIDLTAEQMQIIVTVTAKDEAGNSSSRDVIVRVSVQGQQME